MDLPIFYKLNLKSTSHEEILSLFERKKIGLSPTYLELDEFSFEDAMQILSQLEEIFHSHQINPRFPYPFYLVTTHELSSQSVPIRTNIKELPKYFKSKKRTASAKEAPMIHKLNIRAKKIRNTNITDKFLALEKRAKSSARLYRIARIHSFYEKALENLEE